MSSVDEIESFSIKFREQELNFWAPKDPMKILDKELELCGEESALAPYWAELWPSTEVALKLLPNLLLGDTTTILEIGSGLGVVATALSVANLDIIASDYSADACKLIAHNGNFNGVTVPTICFDWNKTALNSKFKTIVGVDILYEEQQSSSIISFLKTSLDNDGKAYIFDPQRFFWKKFKELAKQSGLQIFASELFRTTEGVEVEMIVLGLE
jgi:predicted nicotinamide N-methyase